MVSHSSRLKSVLLIDECPETQQVLKIILETQGFQVSVIGSTLEAVTSVSKQPPDIVMIDYEIPGESLESFVWSIQSQHPHISIVLMGFGADIAVRAVELGIKRYLRKPFDFLLMLDLVAKSSLQPEQQTHYVV